jgi:hypothetical protein
MGHINKLKVFMYRNCGCRGVDCVTVAVFMSFSVVDTTATLWRSPYLHFVHLEWNGSSKTPKPTLSNYVTPEYKLYPFSP